MIAVVPNYSWILFNHLIQSKKSKLIKITNIELTTFSDISYLSFFSFQLYSDLLLIEFRQNECYRIIFILCSYYSRPWSKEGYLNKFYKKCKQYVFWSDIASHWLLWLVWCLHKSRKSFSKFPSFLYGLDTSVLFDRRKSG